MFFSQSLAVVNFSFLLPPPLPVRRVPLWLSGSRVPQPSESSSSSPPRSFPALLFPPDFFILSPPLLLFQLLSPGKQLGKQPPSPAFGPPGTGLSFYPPPLPLQPPLFVWHSLAPPPPSIASFSLPEGSVSMLNSTFFFSHPVSPPLDDNSSLNCNFHSL